MLEITGAPKISNMTLNIHTTTFRLYSYDKYFTQKFKIFYFPIFNSEKVLASMSKKSIPQITQEKLNHIQVNM